MLHDVMAPERALPWLSLALACGYLLGSIPFGMIMAQVFRLGDLRKIGSGNIGATNVLRTGNKVAAALTLFFDAAKAALAVAIFFRWGDLAAQAAAIGAFIGHCWPVWLRFRGGKGVAAFIGITLALDPLSGALVCATWLGAAFATRISSAGALAAALSAPFWFWLLAHPEAVITLAILAALLWWRHAANIGRLLKGTEPRIGKGKKRDLEG